jgi:hypothetical protein
VVTEEIPLPNPVRQGTRLYFRRHEIEAYQDAIAGYRPRERDPNRPIELVPATQVARELGMHRRTLGRKVAPSTYGTRPPSAAEKAAQIHRSASDAA